ncbi:hypothetical protein GCM10017635_15890 [Paracoccus kondratievae]|uniref:Uncharacterized protein n=1 Tax=Paracoccus kondratievae TaxID=135740 RepID=A0AAD3NYJ1_9RHOB|nr:hypothetical protein GCM10017635_15890 [Paracoccus kondratievae]
MGRPSDSCAAEANDLRGKGKEGERLDSDPSGTRYGCFLPDLTGLARRSPAPTSRRLDRRGRGGMQAACQSKVQAQLQETIRTQSHNLDLP